MEELKLYTKNFDGDRPPEYLYGPSWKAWELLMEGGYPTPEEAKAAWEAEQENNKAFCPTCGKKTNYHLSDRRVEVEVHGVVFKYPEEYAWCASCCQEIFVPTVHDLNCQRRERFYLAHKKIQK